MWDGGSIYRALNNCPLKYGSGALAARITFAAPCCPRIFSSPLPSSDLVAPRLQLSPFIPWRRSNRPNPPARQNPSPRSRASPPGAQAAAIAARRIGGAYGVASAPGAEIWAEETWFPVGGLGDGAGAGAVGPGDPRGGAGPARGRGCRRRRRGGSRSRRARARVSDFSAMLRVSAWLVGAVAPFPLLPLLVLGRPTEFRLGLRECRVASVAGIARARACVDWWEHAPSGPCMPRHDEVL